MIILLITVLKIGFRISLSQTLSVIKKDLKGPHFFAIDYTLAVKLADETDCNISARRTCHSTET